MIRPRNNPAVGERPAAKARDTRREYNARERSTSRHLFSPFLHAEILPPGTGTAGENRKHRATAYLFCLLQLTAECLRPTRGAFFFREDPWGRRERGQRFQLLLLPVRSLSAFSASSERSRNFCRHASRVITFSLSPRFSASSSTREAFSLAVLAAASSSMSESA